jgi:N-acetylmuramoyl-L-alanine amidase
MQLRRLRLGVVALLASCWLGPASAEPAATAATAAKPEASACDRAAFRVVVDVGHTAEVPGAMSARGVWEYEFNLHLAKLVEQKLLDRGFARTVLLITSDRTRRGLFKRVSSASTLSADLFLSIHHDSVPNQFKETWEYEGKTRSFSDRFRGHSIFISHHNVDRQGSLQFARLLGLGLKERGLQYTPHYTYPVMGARRRDLLDAEAGVYRYDQLIVLKNTRMPAVLLEAGSIVHRDEEVLLGTPEHQGLIGVAVTDAVDAFCAARQKVQIAQRPRVLPAARPAAATPVSAARRTAPDQTSSIRRHDP